MPEQELPKDQGTRAWIKLPAIMLLVFMVCAALGGLGYYQFSPPETTCVSCHEMLPSHLHWSNSVHRSISCKTCHGGTADSVHVLRENIKRMFEHLTATRHDEIRLDEKQTIHILHACQSCHTREFAYWRQGGHGTNYAAIFLEEKHNKTEQLADECLRCHGMFFEGKMADMVTPLDTKGPWKFMDARIAQRPAIPCLACHQLHSLGEPFKRSAAQTAGATTNLPAFRRDILAFYVRQEKAHFAIDDLDVPKVYEHGRPVKVSSDPRQRLCMECHAPNAFGEAGTGDDRTPRGVHEGISCAACHAPHSNDARASCALCHPARSSCGLDQTKMDTTFRSRTSKHSIHTVRCLDCHPAGVPKRAPQSSTDSVSSMTGSTLPKSP